MINLIKLCIYHIHYTPPPPVLSIPLALPIFEIMKINFFRISENTLKISCFYAMFYVILLIRNT